MEQTQDNLILLLFRWFLRRSMDDTGTIRQVANQSLLSGAFLVFKLPARGTRLSKHFDRTGPRIDDKNVN